MDCVWEKEQNSSSYVIFIIIIKLKTKPSLMMKFFITAPRNKRGLRKSTGWIGEAMLIRNAALVEQRASTLCSHSHGNFSPLSGKLHLL